MHMERPDYASVKAALRQMTARLEAEATAAHQWANLLKNRDLEKASGCMEGVSQSLAGAIEGTKEAHRLLLEEQEKPT